MAPAAHGGPRGLEVEASSTKTTLLLFRQKAISAETTASKAAPEITASISVHSHCFGISRQVLLFPSVLEAASTFTASTATLAGRQGRRARPITAYYKFSFSSPEPHGGGRSGTLLGVGYVLDIAG